ncbi:WXG100 family type VII secretion target [Lentzea alba]|uniref:WXG100 family type VII secretion target n=1 Tax=Lentzea alba TaxID=2714351 RepID=UPI0039BF7E21
MGAFSLSTDDLDALAKHILDIDHQTQGTLRRVRGAAETVQANWQGQAGTAFQNLMMRLDEDAAKVQEALRSIAEQISESSKTYSAEEEAQNQNIGSLSNRL